MTRRSLGAVTAAVLAAGLGGPAAASGVSGRVRMPELCAPSVSPAVVWLEPLTLPKEGPPRGANGSAFVDQRGMRFDPRVVAVSVGQAVRFGNADPEVHNVHIKGGGVDFNRGVRPGEGVEFVPPSGGVWKVLCDVHGHMRAFVVAADSPWVTTCGASGRFHFDGVPAGPYRVHVWHEMGPPVRKTVEVAGGSVDLGTLAVATGPNPVTADDRALICETGCEPWPLVIDRISVTLASSFEAAQRPGASGGAVALARDAYYRDFEGSGMKAAVRARLGQGRAARIEELFREIARSTRGVASGEGRPASLIAPTREALLRLAKASEDLNRKGVTESSRIFAGKSPAYWVEEAPGGRRARSRGLVGALGRVRTLADAGRPDGASAALGEALVGPGGAAWGEVRAFEPGAWTRFRVRGNALREAVRSGLRGPALGARLDALRAEAVGAADDADADARGGPLAALRAATALALRGGGWLALFLAVTTPLRDRGSRRGTLRALGLGLVAGLVASSILVPADGRPREVVAGMVDLAASAAILGAATGLRDGRGRLLRDSAVFLLAAGAFGETGTAARSLFDAGGGLVGASAVAAGLGCGLALLAGVPVLAGRAWPTAWHGLPPRLARLGRVALAVVVAGEGLFRLQSAQVFRTTALDALGPGLPELGLYPNIQTLAVQALLLTAAAVGPGVPGRSRVAASDDLVPSLPRR